MTESSLKFGTSGLRGLAIELEGQAARRYVAAFLRHAPVAPGDKVFLGQDFRPSSPAIVRDCAAAIAAAGLVPVDCGAIPTPALACYAMEAGSAAIMVTGSHIPADRNGLKFYLPSGEISKSDEAEILAALRDDIIPDFSGALPDESAAANALYCQRFASMLPADALSGMRVGVFEHSSVARDLLARIIGSFGAEIVGLGRLEVFVAVDTEAFGDAVFAELPSWIKAHRLDAIVSADGDGDRPLLMDDRGQFVRGDGLGLLAARFLGADCVVTPVTSNSAIERLSCFKSVIRTRVGSPYVIEAMARASGGVIGFEANGGTLVGAGVSGLAPLPTRDAVLPLLCALGQAVSEGKRLNALVAELSLQYALADRLQAVPNTRSAAFLARLAADADYADRLFVPHGIASLSTIDGLQFRTKAGEIVHFRASGNAPELRCYVESQTPESAQALLEWGLAVAARELG